jgi:cyclic pyranopterin phosphate synthase
MRDKYGRELTYLRVSLIDRCNLRCFYCMPRGPLSPFSESALLTDDEIVEIVSIFAELGIWKVRLTGGEPLLRKDVTTLVRRLKRVQGVRELVMTSNGLLLKRFASELKASGLDRINVSLDTLDRANFERITGLDRFREVLEGIEAAVAAKLTPLKINAVLMKGANDHEILDLVRFAVGRDFHMRFIEWMPTAGEIYSVRNDRYLSAEIAKAMIEAKYRLIKDGTNLYAPAKSFQIEGTASTVGFISPLSNAFCKQCNRLRLKANGMMKTCLHGKEDLDVKALLRQGLPREEIKNRIREVVFDRPEEHFLNNAAVAHNDFVMTAVGG